MKKLNKIILHYTLFSIPFASLTLFCLGANSLILGFLFKFSQYDMIKPIIFELITGLITIVSLFIWSKIPRKYWDETLE